MNPYLFWGIVFSIIAVTLFILAPFVCEALEDVPKPISIASVILILALIVAIPFCFWNAMEWDCDRGLRDAKACGNVEIQR